jgi:hypothetical protein
MMMMMMARTNKMGGMRRVARARARARASPVGRVNQRGERIRGGWFDEPSIKEEPIPFKKEIYGIEREKA